MSIAIRLNPAERIRRASAANPRITDDQLRQQLGVTAGQIKAAMAYAGALKSVRRQA